jgi:osmotically-inducible protein OsmY
MINTLDKTDTEIKTDVLSELKYDPSLKVTEIGVLVSDGVVTLNGYTTSFDEKLAAVHAVKRVAGVVAIAIVAYALLSYLAASLVRFIFYHES